MDELKYWHAVFTASRAEKKVRDRLEELGVECFLPVQTVLRQWTYRKSRVVVPVIAGLVFVRVGRQEQVKVLQHELGDDGDEEIEEYTARIEAAHLPDEVHKKLTKEVERLA